jgi:aminomethyltransferase
MSTETLKHTPLFEEHVRLEAKIVPFAGYEMPVQYPTGILEEHHAVRGSAGLFDVSHMGELEIRGPQALDLVQRVTTNDASKLTTGQAQYSVICREDGGALDDCLVYRFPDHWMIVVNASNRDKDYAWVRKHAEAFDADVQDRSDEIALLALQGPRAQDILARLTDAPLDDIAYYHFAEDEVAGMAAILSRTGYTGEDGFELYIPANDAAELWRRILEEGAPEGILPIGLGARDSLRLEMGYALYGNDLDEQHNPLEAGLGWVVKLDKGDFIGSTALRQAKDQGVLQKLIGFQLNERGFPRHGYVVRHQTQPVGEVTSGILSPTLQRGIGMAYVSVEVAKPGTSIDVLIRDRPHGATVVRPPFHQQGSVRK